MSPAGNDRADRGRQPSAPVATCAGTTADTRLTALAIAATNIGGALGRFAWHRNLGVDPFHLGGVVAPFNRAEVDQGVLFLGLVGEPGRPSLFAAQAHLEVVIGADRNRWLTALASQNHVENSLHVPPPSDTTSFRALACPISRYLALSLQPVVDETHGGAGVSPPVALIDLTRVWSASA